MEIAENELIKKIDNGDKIIVDFYYYIKNSFCILDDNNDNIKKVNKYMYICMLHIN